MAMRLLSLALLGLLAVPTSAALFSGPDLGDYHDGDIYVPPVDVPELPVENLIKIPGIACIVANTGGEPGLFCIVCVEVGGYGDEPIYVPIPNLTRLKVSVSVATGYELESDQWGPHVQFEAGLGNADCT